MLSEKQTREKAKGMTGDGRTCKIPPFFATVLAGGVGGCMGKTATAPLSRLTILYQVAPLISISNSNPHISASISSGEFNGSIFSTFSRVWKQDGLFSFWKGNLTSVIHRFPYSAINFSSYEYARQLFVDQLGFQESSGVRFTSGAVAGGLACFLCYPLDLVRTRLTILQKSACGLYSPGIRNCVSHILHNEGIKGLYKGCLLSIAVSVPNLAIGFSAYGYVKDYLIANNIRTDVSTGKLYPSGSLMSGAVSGVISSLVTLPVDVIRRRMQIMGVLGEGVRDDTAATLTGDVIANASRRTAMVELKRILREEGVRGLYRGLIPELLKVAPMVAITFSVYEITLSALQSL